MLDKVFLFDKEIDYTYVLKVPNSNIYYVALICEFKILSLSRFLFIPVYFKIIVTVSFEITFPFLIIKKNRS